MANVGNIDRWVRVVVGVVLLALPLLPMTAGMFAGWGAWKFAVAIVGVVLIATAGLRFCPLYRILGVNTCALR
ncbi:DUF2892 domain-containing protein [Fertoebacter nigrum]|uniref:DUF2892 domain-containing protein n=2 Tax=Fertoeibacter niger TaxID=2656921 RepID=A0A8X8KQX2_9RHOB|nr:DUF2892 domain-containing protein [Fertoeibacter niger]